MRYIRRSQGSNFIIGVFLLVLLGIVARNYLQDAIASVVPSAGEGIFACERLRQSDNRAAHQSLLGRGVTNPFSLEVRASALPTTADGELIITIIIRNNSLGAVPILYNPGQVQIGDAGFNTGLGIVFNSNAPLAAGAPQGGGFVPESDIRVMGPNQSCVHMMRFPANQLPDPSLVTGNSTVKAYYRNTSQGVTQSSDQLATPIYNDQGLWVGVVESPSVLIRVAGSP